jgi:hypothetical protein
MRSPSRALADLNDTAGDSTAEIVENYKAARRATPMGLVGADHKAIAMFRAESDPDRRTHVSAFEAATDRLEGKVTQPIHQESVGTVRFVFGNAGGPRDEGEAE